MYWVKIKNFQQVFIEITIRITLSSSYGLQSSTLVQDQSLHPSTMLPPPCFLQRWCFKLLNLGSIRPENLVFVLQVVFFRNPAWTFISPLLRGSFCLDSSDWITGAHSGPLRSDLWSWFFWAHSLIHTDIHRLGDLILIQVCQLMYLYVYYLTWLDLKQKNHKRIKTRHSLKTI